jgi:hypothetical protein
MKCKWCGDEFSGGPSRIRAHHSKPLLLPGEKDKGYKLCSSKANAALEFKAKCTAAQEQSQAKKIKKTERDAAVAKQTVAVAFHKESQKLAKKGVVVPKLADMNQQALLAVTRKDLDDDWCNWSAIGKFFLMFMIADVIG